MAEAEEKDMLQSRTSYVNEAGLGAGDGDPNRGKKREGDNADGPRSPTCRLGNCVPVYLVRWSLRACYRFWCLEPKRGNIVHRHTDAHTHMRITK